MKAVVVYAALSKKGDPDQASIESQIAKVRERLAHLYGDDLLVVGSFYDDGHSGSKKNRGPGLEQAIAAVTRAADEHGSAELWANTSARFARGSGRLGEARALGALFYDLRSRGVEIRTVADDEYLRNEMLVGFASAQAAKYSADLSESVKRAKRRQAEKGEHLGGPLPIGYRLDEDKAVVIDPATAPTVERIFDLAAQGVPDSALARQMNSEGFRTRNGRPFDRRAIQAIVTNAFYAARIVYDGETFDAQHEPLIDAATFDRTQAQRPTRDRSRPEQHRAGRPARRHLLSSLAVCAKCGSPMFAYTSPYKRKDGTRARSYQCRSYRFSDGTCDQKPVDAEAIDAAVMERLHDLLPDFETWIAQLEDRHAGERQRLADLVNQAEADRDRQARALDQHERRYRDMVARDDAKADLALEFVADAHRDLADAETRLQATRDALDSIPASAPRDALLDFALSLRDAIRGQAENAHGVEEVNRVLVTNFEAFEVHQEWELHSDAEPIVQAGRVLIEPVLRIEVARRFWPEPLDASEPPAPPLEWIEAVRNSDLSQW